MTDDQITGELSKTRRLFAVLIGVAGAFLLSRLLPDARFWLGVVAVAGISYFVYIVTIIRVWNAHYRINTPALPFDPFWAEKRKKRERIL